MNPRRLRAVAADESDDLDSIVERVARSDTAAFEQLYDRLAPMVYGIVKRVVRDPSMADEVTQEAFVDIWRSAPRFDASRGSVRAFAATIAHRKAVDRVRSEQARRSREEAEHHRSRPDPRDVVAEDATRHFEGQRVRQALAELTETQRQAVELAYFGGRTYREVAALLDVPEGTVKTRIRDGLIKLRDKMGADL